MIATKGRCHEKQKRVSANKLFKQSPFPENLQKPRQPVRRKKIKELLDKPQHYLIAYGTLAPEQSNHHIVSHLKGTWSSCTIRGIIEFKDSGPTSGYPSFIQTDSEQDQPIVASLLHSEALEDNWDMLDEFEGEGYRRTLCRYELADGKTGYGFIYALNKDQQSSAKILHLRQFWVPAGVTCQD